MTDYVIIEVAEKFRRVMENAVAPLAAISIIGYTVYCIFRLRARKLPKNLDARLEAIERMLSESLQSKESSGDKPELEKRIENLEEIVVDQELGKR